MAVCQFQICGSKEKCGVHSLAQKPQVHFHFHFRKEQ
jgi:hypothetical protein